MPRTIEPAERLPASPIFIAVRLAFGAAAIVVLLLVFGALAAEVAAVGLLAAAVLFVPRALVLDEHGFRQVSLIPFVRRTRVPWSGVDSFHTSHATRGGRFVRYARVGRKQRWWYPAGWPAEGSISPMFAPRRGGRALSATDLCNLLTDRAAKARQSTSGV